MNARNLLEDPICSEAELGKPIPDSPHAVSVALPRWQVVVGYEEGRPEVIRALASGYPRFVIHPLVKTLSERLGQGARCLPFPSRRVAQMCADFVRRSNGDGAEVVAGRGLVGVRTSEAGSSFLKAFWQHAGLIVSSRQAEAILAGRRSGEDDAAVRRSLRRQLAAFYDCAPRDVFLTPSGMAAQCAALQAARRRRPGCPTAQLGFPYVDTLKLQQKFGDGGILLHDLERLDRPGPGAPAESERSRHRGAVTPPRRRGAGVVSQVGVPRCVRRGAPAGRWLGVADHLPAERGGDACGSGV